MEKITYKKLKEGYILKEGDLIDTIHGFEGLEVTGMSMCDKCWLHNYNGPNSAIYEYLGIADPKLECAAPEFKSAEELTKHVISLFEKSPYKVGDKVRILEREKDPSDYPFTFVDEMEKLAGETFTIKRIELNTICDRDKYNGDFHQYSLNEPINWNWHSSMFEKVESAEKTEEPKKKRKYSHKEAVVICGKKYHVHDSGTYSFLVGHSTSNRQPFVDLGIIHSIDKEKELMDWIKKRGYTALSGMFPPISNEQFDDFIDLLLQMEKDQLSTSQCQTSEESYKLKDKIKLGKCNYEILKNDRGYFLHNIDGLNNNKMFKELGIKVKTWFKLHDFDYNDGIFPEQKTLEKLTQVIKQLQREFRFRKTSKILEDAIIAATGSISGGSEGVWLSINTSTSPEKLKFTKKKKNIHITL